MRPTGLLFLFREDKSSCIPELQFRKRRGGGEGRDRGKRCKSNTLDIEHHFFYHDLHTRLLHSKFALSKVGYKPSTNLIPYTFVHPTKIQL